MKKKRFIALLCVGALALEMPDVRKKGNPGESKRLRSSRSRLFGSLWTALRIRLWDLRMILISP